MKISDFQIPNINSVKQAINLSNLNKANNQSKQTVDMLKKMSEPTKGQNIDIKV